MPQSYVTLRGGAPALVLPLGVEVRSVALECRSAALALLRGSAWGKRELATWLVSRYRPLASFAKAGAGAGEDAPLSAPVASSRGGASVGALAGVILEAKQRTLGAIQAAVALETSIPVEELENVARVQDLLGERGWVPVDRPRMRLADRVVSLVTAHRLTLPSEFGGSWADLKQLLEEVEVDEAWNVAG
jgi:hypothetical protein